MASNNEPQSPASNTKALHEATSLYKSFYGADADLSTAGKRRAPQNQRLAYGHRETIFGIAFSPDGKYLASASQDSTVKIWDVSTHRLVDSLDGDKDFECLRVAWLPATENSDVGNANAEKKYMLAAAGADGVLRIYSATQQNDKFQWKLVGSRDHHCLLNQTEDRPQIYSLQFVPHPSTFVSNATSNAVASDWLLMTSADDALFFWAIQNPKELSSDKKEIASQSIMQFAQLGQNQFGGPRNPNNAIYVFDAAASTNGLVGAALSDGTCRVMRIAQTGEEKQCVLSVPEQFVGDRGGHLTAISWDSSGERLAMCVACGKVVLWDIKMVEGMLYPGIVALLEGGHDLMRPLFGAKYFGGNDEELLLTWGVDGKVCVWDSHSQGIVTSPICTLVSDSSYPVYALDCTHSKTTPESNSCLAIAGGSEGGFVGVPVHMYDI